MVKAPRFFRDGRDGVQLFGSGRSQLGVGLRAATKERIEEKRGIKVMGEFAFQTLRESITSAIRSKILTGELQPGVKLAEQKLAGISAVWAALPAAR